jgi:hypothetical protein
MDEALSFRLIGAVISVNVVLVFFAPQAAIVFIVEVTKRQGVEASDPK